MHTRTHPHTYTQKSNFLSRTRNSSPRFENIAVALMFLPIAWWKEQNWEKCPVLHRPAGLLLSVGPSQNHFWAESLGHGKNGVIARI